ncbi:hypothetical protein ATK86_7452 [Nocardia fluminea]|uniref:DUF732 domain-containing protein n=1 Tax=Nocardia fluminea TaxID=134984 RepID=A0A2N3V4H8_9NOCA|nr:hypothetical protein ATK86_7452 [Nocardia fluminea]
MFPGRLASRCVSRTTAAIAASAPLFALLLAGCGDDSASAGSPAASTTPAPSFQVEASKAGMFVVSYRNAFPKLAQGRDDAAVAAVLNHSCSEIKAGKSEADTIATIMKAAKNGDTAATTEEATAVYQMSTLMC